MKILLVNQFFWPDSAATSQLLTDVARALADAGHEVQVLCGSKAYASLNPSEKPNVDIKRAPTLSFVRGRAGRALSYGSFLASAFWNSVWRTRPDLVVTLTTPPLLSLLGTFLKKVRGTHHFIWEMDVYPDIAVDLAYLGENSLVTQVCRAMANYSRSESNGVMVLGPCMRERLRRQGVPAHKLHITENWADGRVIQPVPHPPEDRLTILYSGNLGLAHDVDTFSQAMLQLRPDPRFYFIFAGGGFHHLPLTDWCAEQGIINASFRCYCPLSELGKSLGEGDIGLVTQRESCSGSVVPSKVYGVMAAGRPILYIGPKDTTPAAIIKRFGCGWQVDCGDVSGLVSLLHTLSDNPQIVREAGRRARAAFLEHYDLPSGVARVCAVLGVPLSGPTDKDGTDIDRQSRESALVFHSETFPGSGSVLETVSQKSAPASAGTAASLDAGMSFPETT